MLVALGMTMIVSIAAIVVDLGAAYVTAREMQNASDAAAMAGAHTLDAGHIRGDLPTTTAANVDATVRRIAGRNGGQASLITCTYISSDGTLLFPCSSATGSAVADGVQVSVGTVKKTAFANILRVNSMQLDRVAAATVQPLAGQDAPLLVCAFGQTGKPDLLVPVPVVPPLLPPVPPVYLINPLAVSLDNGVTGAVYEAHAPNGVSDCGLPSNSFKGVAGTGPFILPGWLPIGTGVKAGPIRAQIAGQPGCGLVLLLNCVLVLPICSASNGSPGSNGELFCNMFGAFKLVAIPGPNKQDFRLLGSAEAIVGIGGNGAPGPNDVRLIRLIR